MAAFFSRLPKQPWLAHLCGVLALFFLATFLFYPLYIILQRSLENQLALKLTLTNPYYYGRLGFTLGQALLSTLLTVILALPSALLFARFDFWGKGLMRSVFTVPFVMPTVVVGIGFLALFGAHGLSGLDLRSTLLILLLAHVFYNYAVVVRIVSAYLEGMGEGVLQAAQILGSSPWSVLRRVTLPLAAPSLFAAAALVFIFCFTSFGTIMILAPEPRFATLEIEIYRLTSRLQLEGAAVLVLAQLLLVGLFTLVYTALQRRTSVRLSAQRNPLPKAQGVWRLLVALNLGVAALLILSPLLALLYQTFWFSGGTLPNLDAFRFLAQASQEHTLQFSGLGQAAFNSLRFATTSTLLALVVGFCFSYAVARAKWQWLDGLSLLPLAASAITLGYGYILAFPQLRSGPWGMIVAHTLLGFPFVTRSLLPIMRSLPENVFAAAKTLGSSPLSVLVRIELPLLLPGFIAAASFAFAISMGEFGASLVLTRPELATIPVAIFDRLGQPGAQNYAAALALSTVLMLLTAGIFALFERFGEGEL